MHVHDSPCFDTGYDIMSWLGGLTGLVRFCEGAEPFQPETAWLSEEKCGLWFGLLLLALYDTDSVHCSAMCLPVSLDKAV